MLENTGYGKVKRVKKTCINVRKTYPYFKANWTNPFLDLIFSLRLPGWASKASAAPPTMIAMPFPVPSLVKAHSMLSFETSIAPRKSQFRS